MRPKVMLRARIAAICGMSVAALSIASLAHAASSPLALDKFPIGAANSPCEAQATALEGARGSIYDRQWSIICRGVEQPVGTIWLVDKPDIALGIVTATLTCAGSSDDRLGTFAAIRRECRQKEGSLAWRTYQTGRGGQHVVARGVTAYDSAIRLAVQSIVAGRIVPGEVTVVRTGEGSAALDRARIGSADADSLIGQGYRNNAAGSYTVAANLFAGAEDRPGEDQVEQGRRRHEAIVNRALQVSNLAQFAQAAKLFEEARDLAQRDPVQTRLSRNFEAIDALNRGAVEDAKTILARRIPPFDLDRRGVVGNASIDKSEAASLNSGRAARLGQVSAEDLRLTLGERAVILDAQAEQLRGTVARLEGRYGDASAALQRAEAQALSVRDGRVVSIVRLRAQLLSEMALTAEAQGHADQAEMDLRQALSLIARQYPESASLSALEARLAGLLLRKGQPAEAQALYKGVVTRISGNRDGLVGLTNLFQPYFALLAQRATTDEIAARDLFMAAQMIERPGAADTLAQLSRELEGGSNESASLYREAQTIARSIERTRIQIAQLASAGPSPQLEELRAQQQRLTSAQLDVMARLSAFPSYSAIARNSISASDLIATLKPGEAYVKLVQMGERIYVSYASPAGVKGWVAGKSAAEIGQLVSTLRDSISLTVNGVRSTYPFAIDDAWTLSDALLAPVRSDLASVKHLIFEPDGPLLQLPANLLVTDQTEIAAYHQRVANGGDEFDFRNIAWLGRGRAISTALSASSFRAARQTPPSKAPRAYLGLGENVPLGDAVPAIASVSGPCGWGPATWNNPISAAELKDAANAFGPGQSALMLDGAFTDDAVVTRQDLSDFRIIHFATHGLVTSPRDGCPVRPALLTSFGGKDSDGLLRFDEIYRLRLNADLVILSACDTAGQASLEATREAGETTGGGQALDGLVRAFIAAGGRQVIASHWPAPDEFGATEQLFSQMLRGSAGETLGDAIARAQLGLMDNANTSHPFYWSGFALIGDGARPLSPAGGN